MTLDKRDSTFDALTALWNLISCVRKWAAGSFIFCETAAFRELGGFSAELFASESLVKQSRREEAVALLRAAMNDARGTVIADEAKKRLESLK